MAAILSGSGRTVLRYIGGHWPDVIQVSALPFLGIAASLAIQFTGMGPANDHAKFLGVDLPGAVFGTWLWVRLIRLYLTGEKPWVGLSRAVVNATLMTVVYWLGISVVMVVAIIAAWIPGQIGLAIASGIGGQGLFETTSLIILLAQVAFVTWIVCRFAIGMPAVSLGETPRFFADLWGASREVAWSYAWRMILAFALGFVASTLAVLLYKFITLGETGLGQISGSDSIVARFRDLLRNTKDYPILHLVIGQPFGIYIALLAAECFRRIEESRGRVFTRNLKTRSAI
jgi:hypothetical protein